jgi:hypothetical protein
MNDTNGRRHLVVFGVDEIVVNKYMGCIADAIGTGRIDGYSIVDLESERYQVETRLKRCEPQPERRLFLSDPTVPDDALVPKAVEELIGDLRQAGRSPIGYIATEVNAHERYLRFCVADAIDCLVEKPAIAPTENEAFAPALMAPRLLDIACRAEAVGTRCSVMTLSRYHAIYNDLLVAGLRARVQKYGAPVTSIHMRAAGGVWNRLDEFATRDDHLYTLGYGMLMHGAYHYVDLAAQLLELNLSVLGERRLSLIIAAFGAFPRDQPGRMTALGSRLLDDDGDTRVLHLAPGRFYGETDVVACFALQDADTTESLTLGTLSFEQTTPSIRAWQDLPVGVYNKNGRTSSVDVEAQLSSVFTAHVHCYDVPRTPDPDRIDAFARITTRANASLFPDEEYVSTSEYDGLFHSDSNRELMRRFLAGCEDRSTVALHILPTKITAALAEAITRPGLPVAIPFP